MAGLSSKKWSAAGAALETLPQPDSEQEIIEDRE
jgi:hypothetical protein